MRPFCLLTFRKLSCASFFTMRKRKKWIFLWCIFDINTKICHEIEIVSDLSDVMCTLRRFMSKPGLQHHMSSAAQVFPCWMCCCDILSAYTMFLSDSAQVILHTNSNGHSRIQTHRGGHLSADSRHWSTLKNKHPSETDTSGHLGPKSDVRDVQFHIIFVGQHQKHTSWCFYYCRTCVCLICTVASWGI